MLAAEKILFPTDFSHCSRQAFSEAVYLAELLQAQLHVLHVVVLHEGDRTSPEAHLSEPEEMADRLHETALSAMAEMVEEDHEERLSIVKVQRRGLSAAPVILDYVEEEDIDLAVLGTHGWRGATRLLMGSVAAEVVRHAPCPVLTLRQSDDSREAGAVRNILVPVDFSEHSKVALAHAAELAVLYGARLDLLHVIERPVYPACYGAIDHVVVPLPPQEVAGHARGASEEVAERARKALEELAASTPVETGCHLVHGRAASQIVDAATEGGADLVVISTHGLTGLKRLLFGSTAEEVVREAGCPVFTVKSFGKSLVT